MNPGRLDHVADLVTAQVAEHPLTQALAGPLRQAVREELAAHLPRLTRSAAEAADMLGLGTDAICAMARDGRLHRIGGPQSPITLVSILEVAGWPVAPAPLAAPLSVVPTGAEVTA